MPGMFGRGSSSKREPQRDEVEVRGPDSLRTGLLLSTWYIEYRLQEEIDRAHRYGRPLAIMMASPELLGGERLTRAWREAGAEGALQAARNTDLVGWWNGGDGQILIIMPETIADIAQVAASRWRDEMWLRGRAVNGPKWNIALLHDPDEFKSRDLIDTVMRQRIELEQTKRAGRVHVEDEEAA